MIAAKVKVEPGQLLIDGQWVDGAKKFDTVNPATGEVLTQIAEGSNADVDRAVEAARRALEDRNGPWRKMSASERGRLIWKLADLLEKNIDEFAELETLDNGKPIFESRYVDMPMVIDVLRYYAGLATKIRSSAGGRVLYGGDRAGRNRLRARQAAGDRVDRRASPATNDAGIAAKAEAAVRGRRRDRRQRIGDQ